TVVTLTATPNEPVASSPSSTFGDSTVTPAVPGWGGACTPTEKNPDECTLTMDSAQSATASFDLPGQSQTTPISTTGITDNYNNGTNDFTFAPASGTAGTLSVTEIPIGDDCNAIVQANFGSSARCFDVFNGGGPGTDTMLEFEVTCPGSATGGTCGSIASPTFFGTLGQDFFFQLSDNQGLAVAGAEPNQTLTSSSGGPPYVGFFQFSGPDPLHPCTLAGPVSNSANIPKAANQISFFNFIDGTPGAKPAK